MSVESDNDRLALLNDFGVEAEVNGRIIIGILDNDWEDGLGVSVNTPVFTVRMIDINGVSRTDKIHIENINYTIAEIHDDGQGMGNIILQKT